MPTPSPAVVAANRMTARWAGRHREGPTVQSGVGVWVLLAALEGGATGTGLDQLEAAVGLPAADALAAVREVIEVLGSSPALHAALGLWFRDSVPVEAAWLDQLPPRSLGRLTGDLDADQATLDAWADAETQGEIDRFPIHVDDSTMSVLASALSVRTEWSEPFVDVPSELPGGPWAGMALIQLHRTTTDLDDLRVADDGLGQLTMARVEGDGDVDVWLLLGGPDAPPEAVLDDGLAALASLDDTVLGSELPDGRPGPGLEVSTVTSTRDAPQLVLSTVAFEVDAEHDLLEQADVFGLRAATDDSVGHFPGISSFPLAIQQARQTALARFHATGFEAAAVTAMAQRAGSAMPTTSYEVRRVALHIDRPFAFAAVHRPSGLILATGWVTEPAQPADEPI